MRLTLDKETTTKNKGHPLTPENFVVSYSYQWEDNSPVFKYYTEPDFLSHLQEVISKATTLIGHNIKFDILWLMRMGIKLPKGLRVFDTMIAEFIVCHQQGAFPSLNDCLEKYGIETKVDAVAEMWELGIDTPDIPVEILEEYNNGDVSKTYQLYLTYLDFITAKQHKLILLQGLDLLALAEAEFNGMKYNRSAALDAIASYKAQVASIQDALWDYVPEACRKWFNWNSGEHLSVLLYGGAIDFDYFTSEPAIYKSGAKKGEAYVKNTWHVHTEEFAQRFKPLENTAVAKCLKPDYKGTMFYQVDDPTLQQLKSRKKEDKQLLSYLADLAKKSKVVEMLEQFEGKFVSLGWEDNLVHGQFNQVVAATGRLSSSNPNLQNTPEEVDAFLISRYD